MILSLKWLFILLLLLNVAYASVGDSSPFFHHCVRDCNTKICDIGEGNILNYDVFGFVISFWSCKENCEYRCQWKTVEAFQKKNWKIPQFRGKWPFIRILGLQEPASAVFSLFNFLVVLKMFLLFRKKVSNESPYYYVWYFYTGVCLNCWLWSSIYHTRENEFTEKMDYMSAFLMVLCSFYTMGLRQLTNTLTSKTLFWTIFCICIGVNHLTYLCLYYFDYAYNMVVNCVLGSVTVVGWLYWTTVNYTTHYHSWKVALYAISVAAATLLEIIDFPPIFWVFDAHSLWHLSTVFINVIFYKFIIDDCNYLNEAKNGILLSKTKIK